MQKGCMLKLMSVVALVILTSATDAAPITAEVPDLQQTPLRGNKNPTDPWTSDPEGHYTTTYIDRQEIMVPVQSSDSLDETISSRHFLDKIFTSTNNQDRTLDTASIPHEHANILAATNQLFPDPVIDHTPVGDSSVYKTQKVTSVTGNLNNQSKSRIAKVNTAASNSEDRREKMLQMLSALEELHRSLDNSRNSRLTIISRGNSNSRGPGKKTKMIMDMKTTTVSSVVSKGASLKASTDQMDPKLLNGKAFKKSLPSTPKKTNKRVCFWKYCSQN